MRRDPIVAYMMCCFERREVRNETLANLDATDWGASPVVVLDQRRHTWWKTRVIETGRAVLARAVAGPGDVFLFMEDDLEFNRALRHNLEHWRPLLDHKHGDHFFGSLYNPNIAPVATETDPEPYCTIDPNSFYGSQAVVMSVTTAGWILDHWDDHWEQGRGLPDIRMSRLAGQRSPVYMHRPSLVQHRDVPSLWGGVAHHAIDFSPDWRSSER